MTLTLQEVKEKLAEQYDEVTLLEILEINSYDIVEAFFEKIEEKYDKLTEDLEEETDSSAQGID
ncbi:MAG: hypothetical protein KGL35_13580 [Bradyrhizobium sp.]|nr:hypothetical protein [Nitrososphaerota archaeon]MDE2469730.1 hypothetical protein [Bradyrhizobium sp.]